MIYVYEKLFTFRFVVINVNVGAHQEHFSRYSRYFAFKPEVMTCRTQNVKQAN